MVKTDQGPETRATEVRRMEGGASTDLACADLRAPEYMREADLRPNSHTPDSVKRKWGERSLSTGVSIQCRIVGGAT